MKSSFFLHIGRVHKYIIDVVSEGFILETQRRSALIYLCKQTVGSQ